MAKKPQINIEKDLCELLRECYRGSESPVASKALESIFCVKGTEIRRAVNTLRCKGEPICSNIDGYFYATDQHELDATIAQLTSRIKRIADARDGLLNRSPVF